MREPLDVLVVGTGFGGLTAAALAARSGLSVHVLERHTRPGGCAGDFALEGFAFPAGATVVTGLEDGGILDRVFSKLDITLTKRELDPSIVFEVAGRALSYYRDVERWKAELRGAFPLTAPAYDAFWDWTHSAGGAVYKIGAVLPSLPLERWADVRRTLPAARVSALRTIPLLWRTVGAQMQKLGAAGEPAIDAMIDSLLMDATGAQASACSAVQGAIALDLYRRGCQWVEGGTGKLAMQFVRSIRANGGAVQFGVGVERMERSGDYWHAQLDNGTTVRTRVVIANVPPAGLDRLLGRQVTLPLPDSAWGAFVLHLGIDATGLTALHPYHQVIDEDASSPNAFVSIFPSRNTIEAKWAISVSCHVDANAWNGFPDQIENARTELEEQLLCAVERVIPDVRERVRVLQSATPGTFERYTGRPGGFVGGLVQRPNIVALRAPGHRPARGLFTTGDHYFPGQGTVGTALSGINAYRDAAESLGKRAIL